jgi:hypothetical protein
MAPSRLADGRIDLGLIRGANHQGAIQNVVGLKRAGQMLNHALLHQTAQRLGQVRTGDEGRGPGLEQPLYLAGSNLATSYD